MPDSEDYEELGRLLASPPSWTPTEAATMHKVIGSAGGATIVFCDASDEGCVLSHIGSEGRPWPRCLSTVTEVRRRGRDGVR